MQEMRLTKKVEESKSEKNVRPRKTWKKSMDKRFWTAIGNFVHMIPLIKRQH